MHFGPVITPLGRPPVLLKGEPKVHYIMVPLEFRKRGDKLFMQGNLAEAILCYQEALKLKPDYAEVYNNMGMAFKRHNQLEAAVKCYRDALKINPEYDVACNNLANAFNEQGKLNDAKSFYQKALELTPNFAEAHNNLGNVLKEQGQLGEAILNYQAAPGKTV